MFRFSAGVLPAENAGDERAVPSYETIAAKRFNPASEISQTESGEISQILKRAVAQADTLIGKLFSIVTRSSFFADCVLIAIFAIH